jgi:hypothetical protein
MIVNKTVPKFGYKFIIATNLSIERCLIGSSKDCTVLINLGDLNR